MSVEIVAKLICDGCRAEITGTVQRETSSGQLSYWDAKKQAKKRGWVKARRYGTAKHFCAGCAIDQARAERNGNVLLLRRLEAP